MDKHRNKNRSRKYGIVIHLSEDEKYILDEKTKCSNMTSRAAFIRHLILYGYVYEVSHSYRYQPITHAYQNTCHK